MLIQHCLVTGLLYDFEERADPKQGLFKGDDI